ncbi:hypothetical protein [Streptomyces sp. NPDC018693]|uniref:hypothetical protein n=1 Tax=unclassified Streptomyces TaxID=2593676 RepID=UPI003790F1C2
MVQADKDDVEGLGHVPVLREGLGPAAEPAQGDRNRAVADEGVRVVGTKQRREPRFAGRAERTGQAIFAPTNDDFYSARSDHAAEADGRWHRTR